MPHRRIISASFLSSSSSSVAAAKTGTRSRRRNYRTRHLMHSCLAFLTLTSTIIVLSCLSQVLPQAQLPSANAEPYSTIPRSNNRYTRYNLESSEGNGDSDTLSAPSVLNSESYQPPWNPSPKINPEGFLTSIYPRCPGEWEVLANIRGRHGPRNAKRYVQNLSVPVRIRQVPGDGNCLFHSIAACLHHEVNGTHLPMSTHENFSNLRVQSLRLRNAAVDILQSSAQRGGLGRRRLFLQGEEYLEARELLNAAAAQFDLEGEEYCDLMRKESYWGGGPEIVALCNYLQRPIHIYELIPAEEATNTIPPNNNNHATHNVPTCNQFTLRRMACFGSPKYDRRDPLHILSADSRFPDIEPRRIRKVGNHFLAMFPVSAERSGVKDGGGEGDFRRHALIRGGSRLLEGAIGDANVLRNVAQGGEKKAGINDRREVAGQGSDNDASRTRGKWDGGRGKWD